MSVGIDANGNSSTAEQIVIDAAALGDQLSSTAPMYDVMPDGEHFLVCLVPPSALPPHCEVVVNWFEEIKRLTTQ